MTTILFASMHDFPPYTKGGGELCVVELLREITLNTSTHCVVLASSNNLTKSENYYWEGIEVRRVPEQIFSLTLISIVKDHKPNAILTYLEGTGTVSDVGLKYNIPTGLFIVDRGGVMDGISCFSRKPIVVISLSNYLSDLSKSQFQCNPLLFPPILEVGKNDSNPSSEERFEFKTCGLINLNRLKGAHLFHSLAQACSHYHFVAVQGWSYKEIAPCILGDEMNYKLFNWTNNIDTFYQKLSILLIPSLCPEGFGRVAREAIQRGIPVIASNRGALYESACEIGDFLDPTNPTLWKRALTRLLESKEYYISRSAKGKKAAMQQTKLDRLMVTETVQKLIKILQLS